MKKYLFLGLSLLMLFSCDPEQTKTKQYVVNGQRLYMQYCTNCHQADGRGVGKLYPPLNGSDFLKDQAATICAIRYGLKGEIMVNGQLYDQPMPAMNTLKPLDIAEIATFISITWGGGSQRVTVDQVNEILSQCKPVD
ncbi:cytochrome c [Persicobacter psychrovividus]|uniref:Cytochrome c domain-containing protein n=1 Tax=Persicobacter psychrovividus TaxID=387638 RepID=A0ABN6L8Z7_9BACT|nr:hypothetical protein PEPS_19460 [Persicobacter psychrovividus]